MVLWLLSLGLYLGSALSLPCSLPRTRAFSFIFACVFCVWCAHTYLRLYVCGHTQKPEVDIICLPSLLLLRQGLSLDLELTDEARLARQRPWGIPLRAGITGALPNFLGFYVDIQTLVFKLS